MWQDEAKRDFVVIFHLKEDLLKRKWCRIRKMTIATQIVDGHVYTCQFVQRNSVADLHCTLWVKNGTCWGPSTTVLAIYLDISKTWYFQIIYCSYRPTVFWNIWLVAAFHWLINMLNKLNNFFTAFIILMLPICPNPPLHPFLLLRK